MGRRKKDIEKNVEDLIQEEWDIKKIIVGVVAIVIIGLGMIFVADQVMRTSVKSSVLGTAEDKKEELEDKRQKVVEQSKEDFEKLINQVKKEVEGLGNEDFSSKSPRIQNIIDQLHQLQGKSKDPKDLICEYVCKKD